MSISHLNAQTIVPHLGWQPCRAIACSFVPILKIKLPTFASQIASFLLKLMISPKFALKNAFLLLSLTRSIVSINVQPVITSITPTKRLGCAQKHVQLTISLIIKQENVLNAILHVRIARQNLQMPAFLARIIYYLKIIVVCRDVPLVTTNS